MTQRSRSILTVQGVDIPLTIVSEPRGGWRFSFIKNGVSMRIPAQATQAEFEMHQKRLMDWVESVFEKQPDLRRSFLPSQSGTGDVLEVNGRQYLLNITYEAQKVASARLREGTIFVHMSSLYTPEQQKRALKTLISRIVGQDFTPEIHRRVLDWNDRTFKRPITGIHLKYNHSNWGSCSSAGNVNLSTKLLLTPTSIQDYVILHELAHLIEMNHSPRFWALVAQHMPDYKARKKWLREHQSKFDFFV